MQMQTFAELVLKGFQSISNSTDFVSLDNGTQNYMNLLEGRRQELDNTPELICPPSREQSPESEARIETLRERIRTERDRKVTLNLVLTCTGLHYGGDWRGEPVAEDEDIEYIIPRTEEEWFQWEKDVAEKRERRLLESQRLGKVEKWKRQLQQPSILEPPESFLSQEFYPPEAPVGMGEDLAPPAPQPLFARETTEPVERGPSPPPAPALGPMASFNDSLSYAASGPYLPFVDFQELSFNIPSQNVSTPKPATGAAPVNQLSSPVSPPHRSLKPLHDSEQRSPPSSKRARNNEETGNEAQDDAGVKRSNTPRPSKRTKTQVEPITPKSVERPSQEARRAQGSVPAYKHLPTLSDILQSSKSSSKSRKSSRKSPTSTQGHNWAQSPTPARGNSQSQSHSSTHGQQQSLSQSQSGSLIQSYMQGQNQMQSESQDSNSSKTNRRPQSPSPSEPSQPHYSAFWPQFESTQQRSQSQPPVNGQKSGATPASVNSQCLPSSSAGMYYQSQFPVEQRMNAVEQFLQEDVFI